MTKLLSDSDFAEIRNTINDVSETFLEKEVTVKRKTQSLDRMNRDLNTKGAYTDVVVKGLLVWQQVEVEKDRTTGIMDFSDGYVLLNFDEIEPTTLIESGKVNIVSGVDLLLIDGESMEIIGIEPLGQLKDKMTMVKVYFKRKLKNH